MRFGILGPLEVTEGTQHVRVGGPKVRTLLGILLVHADEVVSADALADALWGQKPPGNIPNALQTQVSRLRRALDGGVGARLVAVGTGYRLRVTADELDALAFEGLSTRAGDALAAGEWETAAEAARRALALWRGEALADLRHEPFAEARAAQLDELRLLTTEHGIDAGLALGRHHQLAGELRQLVAGHPTREGLWRRLMLVLYRSGRQAEALRAFGELRDLLVEELGISPSAELVDLERAILDQDESLAPRAPEVATATAPAATARLETFLFTDVERAPAAWDRDDPEVAGAVRRHDGLVRAAVTERGGRVFGRPGDGFCVAFAAVDEAVAAALDAQRRLADDGGLVRVRMAVHTGQAEAREGGFFGSAVNRVARMRDAGHGGQVLVSAASRELLGDDLPDGADLVDVGTWLFEGFSRPERVYQLAHPALGGGFPPLRSGRPSTGTIPRHSTSFVGRHREVARTLEALAAGHLVTLTGEGGAGKTRLALELAHRADLTSWPDGVWFCDLSTVEDEAGVAEQVTAALQRVAPGGADVWKDLVGALAGVRLLLIVDNCEQVRDAVARLVDEVLSAGTEARVLATSRAPLRARGERVVHLGPLALPEPGAADAGEAPAIQLLVDRARAAGADVTAETPALSEVVHRLDGLPLTIELAAPRLATMSAAALAARLDGRFDLLTGPASAPARQRSLRATLDWSFGLLDGEARTLFGALSIFRGGWTLDTAEDITAAAGIDRDAVALLMADLAEQSMVRMEASGGTTRYRLLETMRSYAAQYLVETGADAAVAKRHAHHFIGLAERAAVHRRGPLEPAWVRALEVEFDNLRAAYRWGLAADPRAALRLVAALADDAIMRERLEIGRWAEALAAHPEVGDEPLRAVALALAANTALVEARFDEALRLSRAALDVEARTGATPSWIPRNILALLAVAQVAPDLTGGWHHHLDAMEAVSRDHADPLAAAVAFYDRALMAALTGRPERGLAAADALLDLATDHGNPSMLAMGLVAHGRAVAGTERERAAKDFHDALAVASTASNTLLVQQALRAAEELGAAGGDRPAALAALRGVARRFERSGNLAEQLQTLVSMLDPLVAMGALEAAATICGGLSRTPWRLTAAWGMVDRAVADRLPRDDYMAARRKGVAMPAPELVAYASRFVQGLVA